MSEFHGGLKDPAADTQHFVFSLVLMTMAYVKEGEKQNIRRIGSLFY